MPRRRQAHGTPSSPDPAATRILSKYAVGEDYIRDMVMPAYDRFA